MAMTTVDFMEMEAQPRPIRQQLSLLVRGLGEMERHEDVALQPSQAKRIVAVVAPWQNKPHLSASAATEIRADIHAILSPKQKGWLHEFMAQFPPYGGMSGGDYGSRDQYAIALFRREHNPLCRPDASPRFRHLPAEVRLRYHDRYDQRKAILDELRRKAKSADANNSTK